jgi:MoaA/NifB/PqqE/SkfB family radical SAM enzyme
LFCVVSAGKVAEDMGWPMFEQTLELVGPGCIVALFGAGEGLLHPRFLDMVWACKAKGAVTTVTTNGVAVSRIGAEVLRDAGLDTIAFSIAGIGPEHERLQVGVTSSEVWYSLEACAKVGIHTKLVALLLRQNVQDGTVRRMIARASAAGAKGMVLQEILAHESWSIYQETLQSAPDREDVLRSLLILGAFAEHLGMEVEVNYDRRSRLL